MPTSHGGGGGGTGSGSGALLGRGSLGAPLPASSAQRRCSCDHDFLVIEWQLPACCDSLVWRGGGTCWVAVALVGRCLPLRCPRLGARVGVCWCVVGSLAAGAARLCRTRGSDAERGSGAVKAVLPCTQASQAAARSMALRRAAPWPMDGCARHACVLVHVRWRRCEGLGLAPLGCCCGCVSGACCSALVWGGALSPPSLCGLTPPYGTSGRPPIARLARRLCTTAPYVRRTHDSSRPLVPPCPHRQGGCAAYKTTRKMHLCFTQAHPPTLTKCILFTPRRPPYVRTIPYS